MSTLVRRSSCVRLRGRWTSRNSARCRCKTTMTFRAEPAWDSASTYVARRPRAPLYMSEKSSWALPMRWSNGCHSIRKQGRGRPGRATGRGSRGRGCGFGHKIRDRQVPQPLSASLFLRNTWLLPPDARPHNIPEFCPNCVDPWGPIGMLRLKGAVKYEAIVSHLCRALPGLHILPVLMRLTRIHLP